MKSPGSILPLALYCAIFVPSLVFSQVGDQHFQGDVEVKGNFLSLTNTELKGPVLVEKAGFTGPFTVTSGSTTFNGPVGLPGGVSGSATFPSSVTMSGGAGISGGATISGGAGISGGANLSGGVGIDGSLTTTVGSSASINSDAFFRSSVTASGLVIIGSGLSGTLQVNGSMSAQQIAATGVMSFGTTLTGSTVSVESIQASEDLSSAGVATFLGSTTFSGAIGASKNVTVSSSALVTGNLRVSGTITGNLTGNVTGNSDTATALAGNGTNCSSGNFPLGVDASGAVESCTDAATQGELDGHTGGTGATVHGAVATNSANQIVTRDGSGNFAAGTITATLSGNATTASALANNGGNCSAGQYPLGVDAAGAVESCTAAGVGDAVLSANQSFTGTNTFTATTIFPSGIKGGMSFVSSAAFSGVDVSSITLPRGDTQYRIIFEARSGHTAVTNVALRFNDIASGYHYAGGVDAAGSPIGNYGSSVGTSICLDSDALALATNANSGEITSEITIGRTNRGKPYARFLTGFYNNVWHWLSGYGAYDTSYAPTMVAIHLITSACTSHASLPQMTGFYELWEYRK